MFEESVLDRILQILGLKKNMCPFGVEPFVQDPSAKEFELKFLICDPLQTAACPQGYACDRSRQQGAYICCSDPLSTRQIINGGVATLTRAATTTTQTTRASTASTPWSVWTSWSLTSSTADPASRLVSTSTTSGSPVSPTNDMSTRQRPISTTFGPWRPPNPFASKNSLKGPQQTQRIWSTDSSEEEIVTAATSSAKPTSSSSSSSSTTTEHSPSKVTPTGFLSNMPDLIILAEGKWNKIGEGEYHLETSVTLVKDEDKWLLVDTGVPSDTDAIVRELARHDLRPDSVDMVILTHSHPAHVGNLNLFATKKQIFGDWQYESSIFKKTRLAEAQIRKLTTNTELWKTPGHTQDDLSLIVKNVPQYGTVAVVGDLILREDEIQNPNAYAASAAWNTKIRTLNIKTVLCTADWIIPGHGAMFKVKPEYKVGAGCKPNAFVFSPFSSQDVWYQG